ncbi:helix-turn-helix domain-containing protein [Nocardia sp. NPDC048505]|uniref:helix-turn-helix domain-containing protein n=1 Tax=unclassified Nocardia TaxID=2637762 RepID=UPI0033D79320
MLGDEPDGRDDPLTTLRNTLSDALARRRLTKTQLASRAGLGRTTVQEVFRSDGAIPSAETVAALAQALGLAKTDLLVLRRKAVGLSNDSMTDRAEAPGRPIGQWDPYDLEIHPCETAPSAHAGRMLPGYVTRAHDRVLAQAVDDVIEGNSRLLVLVGSSSTGKTRACWEAVQPLAAMGWRLWHPFDPTRAEAALADLERVAPHTVVWFNEAQHYLGDPRVGERISAALHTLLIDPGRAPVLVLGTLWPEYADHYTALPRVGSPDLHSRAREVLAGATVTIPDTFNRAALASAASLAQAGDWLLADALTRAGTHGRVAQDLAGAPELMRRYEQGTPTVKALLEAAMDARRLGVGIHLPQAFLTDAAADYLGDEDWDRLPSDWAEAAYADLARPVHGKQVPLGRTIPRPARRPPASPTPTSLETPPSGVMLRLADYLEQLGRNTRRHLCPPASFWHAADIHLTDAGDLNNLGEAARERDRLQWAHHLRLRAAAVDHPHALNRLGAARERAGDREGAAAFYRRAADLGDPRALKYLARIAAEAGDQEEADSLYQRAADGGDADAIREVAMDREEIGDFEGAAVLFRQAAEAGDSNALAGLMMMREEAGDTVGAEAVAREAAGDGDRLCFTILAEMRDEAGDRKGAEAIAQEAAASGDLSSLLHLWRSRLDEGDLEGAETAFQLAAEANSGPTLAHAARSREESGDQAGAEAVALAAAAAGDFYILRDLERMRAKAGDEEGLESLYLRAADAGEVRALLGRWSLPYGLDPDGSPAAPWCEEGYPDPY